MSQPELTFNDFERELKSQAPTLADVCAHAHAHAASGSQPARIQTATLVAPAHTTATALAWLPHHDKRSEPVRVLALAMSQTMLRFGLQSWVERAPGLLWLDDSPLSHLAGPGERQAKPDVVLMDGDSAGLACLSKFDALKRLLPGLRLVLLRGLPAERSAMCSLFARRAGWVLDKGVSSQVVIAAIRAVHRGERLAGAERIQTQDCVNSPPAPAPGRSLTRREREVLGLLSQGLSNHRIAEQLGLKTATVKFHVTQILNKLQADNRTSAVLLSLRRGLVGAA